MTTPLDARTEFEALMTARGFDISTKPDAWGQPTYAHPSIDAFWYGWQAARSLLAQPEAPTPKFEVSVFPMPASNGVTYYVSLDRVDRRKKVGGWAWHDDRITPINRNDVEEANCEGEKWADFLGVPFVPCAAVKGRLPNTVPQYGQDMKPAPEPPVSAEVEPVAWRYRIRGTDFDWKCETHPVLAERIRNRRDEEKPEEPFYEFEPLYTHPAAGSVGRAGPQSETVAPVNSNGQDEKKGEE